MPERVLIETCSPTLAGMKPANLISLPYQNEEQARADIREMNRIFARRVFRRYQSCTRAYLRSWECGKSLEELTVAEVSL